MESEIESHSKIDFHHKTVSGLVSVVVVCYEQPEMVSDVVSDLEAQTYDQVEIVCVLNGRDKETVDRLDGSNAKVVIPEENLWYSEGNNYGVARTRGEFIFILNPDTRIPPSSIETIVSAAQETDAATYVPKVLNYPDTDTIDSIGKELTVGGWISSIGSGCADDGTYDTPIEVAMFDGSAFVIRRSTVEKHGLFDERFKVYEETNDLGLRLQAAEERIVTVPDAEVYHMGGKSYENETHRSETFSYYGTRNDLATIAKNFHPLYLFIVLPIHIIWPLRSAFSLIRSGNFELAMTHLKGLGSGLNLGVDCISGALSLQQQYCILFELPKIINEGK